MRRRTPLSPSLLPSPRSVPDGAMLTPSLSPPGAAHTAGSEGPRPPSAPPLSAFSCTPTSGATYAPSCAASSCPVAGEPAGESVRSGRFAVIASRRRPLPVLNRKNEGGFGAFWFLAFRTERFSTRFLFYVYTRRCIALLSARGNN